MRQQAWSDEKPGHGQPFLSNPGGAAKSVDGKRGTPRNAMSTKPDSWETRNVQR
jgi:hypothetical protein